MFQTAHAKYWVSMVAFLLIIFVGSQHYHAVEELAFERGGIWIFLIVAIWGSFHISPSDTSL